MAPLQSTRFKLPHRDWTNILVYWKCLIPVSQVWGMFTAIVLFGIGLHQLFTHNIIIGINITFSAVGLFGLESHLLLVTLSGKPDAADSESPRCWTLLGDVQHPWNLWRKSAVYWLMSLLLFTQAKISWMYEASGIQLIILAALYLLMFIQHELRVRLLRQSTTSTSTSITSKIFRIRTISLAGEEEEMAVFEKIPETPESEESQQEEDPGLVEIQSLDEDPMLTM